MNSNKPKISITMKNNINHMNNINYMNNIDINSISLPYNNNNVNDEIGMG